MEACTHLHFTFALELDFSLKPSKPVITLVLWAENERVVNNLKQLLEVKQTQMAASLIRNVSQAVPAPCY